MEVVGLRSDQPGADGVRMDVANEVHQIRVRVAQAGPVSVLEQMAAPAVATVEILGVPTEQALHPNAQGEFTTPNHQMDVVRHQNIRDDTEIAPLATTNQRLEEGEAVAIVAENPLAVHAARIHVMDLPRKIAPRSSCHRRRG